MIDVIIRGSLGQFGSALLDLYIANSLWINSLILIYVLLMVLGRRSYSSMKASVQNHLVEKYGKDLSDKPISWFTKTLSQNPIDWETVKQSTKIPFVAQPGSWFVSAKTTDSLSKIFNTTLLAKLFTNESKNTIRTE